MAFAAGMDFLLIFKPLSLSEKSRDGQGFFWAFLAMFKPL
jgi:hypothetical protein